MNTRQNRHITSRSLRLLPLLFGIFLLISCSGSKSEGLPTTIAASIDRFQRNAQCTSNAQCTMHNEQSSQSSHNSQASQASQSSHKSQSSQKSRKPTPLTHAEILALLSPADTVRAHNPYEVHLDSMPPGGIKMKINPVGGYLGRVFNDSNKFHIARAEELGIVPLNTLGEAWRQGNRLEPLRTCEAYYLDNLTHSLPYLVPEAHQLLKEIGLAFRDSLRSRGGGDYRIKVTSVLRTPALVKQLRRRNRNAVDTSAHLYGTTFDISYLKFICDSARTPRTQEDMKNLLAEVIMDFHERGRCYVKYERKQACFHITTR